MRDMQRGGGKAARILLGLLAVVIASVLLAIGLFLLVSDGGCFPVPASSSGTALNGQSRLIRAENVLALAMPAIFSIRGQTETKAPEKTTPAATQAMAPSSGRIAVESLSKTQEPGKAEAAPAAAGPLVLIYHSHTHEAYRQEGGYTYIEVSSWRTSEQDKSVVAVGEYLAEELSTRYGIQTLHDTTDNEGSDYYNSYPTSLKMIEKDMKQYPTIQVLIDLHRDAYSGESGKNDVAIVDGQRTAKVMFVVGTGEGKTGNGFTVKPDWKQNLSFASAVTSDMEKYAPQVIKPIRMKTGRYNMHMSNRTLVVEVGHNMNTLEEAKNAVPFIAKAIADVIAEFTSP
jgi:stage II sporulation protein P